MNYLLLLATVLLTVYAQIVTKWQVLSSGPVPPDLPGKLWLTLHLLINPWIVSCYFATFMAFLCWIAAISQIPLSRAYPTLSLTYPIVLVSAVLIFGESMTTVRLIGVLCIMIGVVAVNYG